MEKDDQVLWPIGTGVRLIRMNCRSHQTKYPCLYQYARIFRVVDLREPRSPPPSSLVRALLSFPRLPSTPTKIPSINLHVPLSSTLTNRTA